MNTYKTLITIFFGLLFFANLAKADAPVVDLNDLPENTTPSSSASKQDISPDTKTDSAPDTPIPAMPARDSLPTNERLRLLEQQMNNFVQMNLPGKIDSLEQQLNQLNGQLEEKTHTIEQLQDQLKNQNSLKTPTDTDHPESTTRIPPTQPSLNPSALATNNQDKTTDSISQKETITNRTSDASRQAYQTALSLMMQQKNEAAITAFQTFIKQYPTSTDVPIAHYWLAQAYTLTNKTDQATQEFSNFVRQYPAHQKIPDALLKLALIHDDAGKHAQAKKELQALMEKYPNTEAAKLAKMRLKTMTP